MIKQAPKGMNFRKLEENIQTWWEENRIYEKVKEEFEEGQKYYFLDGPPYASGAIHLGTAWNKIMKDSILRYLSMNGYNVRRQPGWDCHGLPIEVKVERELGIKNKKEIEGDVESFINACRDWAVKHVDIMTEQFKKLGVWMDWDKPYMTLNDDYIESAWWTIKQAHEKGLLTRDLRVVNWCPRCQTALADAELEYSDRTDPSIYVKFPVLGKENEYLLIWTTTPWTIIANLAVMVNPEFDYARVKTPKGVLILARELVPMLKDKFGIEYEILETFKGNEIEGLRYENPLKDYINIDAPEKAYRVILADFVVLGEGTGCVHSAPGHGPEDFEACKSYGILAICPVDEEGKFTLEAGKYAGMKTKVDDKVIIRDLSKKGALLKAEHITHRYGHCWRCNSPIIYRATEQWFIRITRLKEKMLEELEKVDWVPDWAGSARFKDWIENARDWTISRQRYWGIPLPVWVCEKCGDIRVIGTKEELDENIKELHRPYVDRVKLKCSCGGEMERVKDVLDVWFDSGIAAWASLGHPGRKDEFEKWYPAEFITEGHDQTRGWFYSQLGCGLLAFNEVPYRRVLMHGFTLDEKGEKMSKSIGNVVAPEEVAAKYSVDILRFYVLWSNKPWDDLKFNWEEVNVISKMFNILWNAFVFSTSYMSIDSFDPAEVSDKVEDYLRDEDRWILSRLHSTIAEVKDGFETLHLYRATRALYNFIVEDLSRWYIPLMRPRSWDEKESMDKIAAYSVLYRVFYSLSKTIAPVAPHLAEEIYRSLDGDRASVHLEKFPQPKEKYLDKVLEENMEITRKLIEASNSARDRAKLKRRWPARRLIVYPEDEKTLNAINTFESLIKAQANTLELEVKNPEESFREARLKAKPNFSTLGPEFRGISNKVADFIEKSPPEKLREIIEEGKEVEIDDEKIRLNKEHIIFEEILPENLFTADFDSGIVLLDAERIEEVKRIGYAREIVRRIQEMRKELQLNIEAFIATEIEADGEILRYIEDKEEYIKRETRSKAFARSKSDEQGYVKEWNIAGHSVRISIKPLEGI